MAAIHRLEDRPAVVGVFVNSAVEEVNHIAELCQLDWVQLSGDESWQYCREIKKPLIKVIHISAGKTVDAILADMERGYRMLKKKELICLLDSQVGDADGGSNAGDLKFGGFNGSRGQVDDDVMVPCAAAAGAAARGLPAASGLPFTDTDHALRARTLRQGAVPSLRVVRAPCLRP